MAERLRINGQNRLNGTVTVSGAKNSVLKLMAASLLTDEPVTLTNVPDISDVAVMCDVLTHLGGKVTREPGKLIIQGDALHTFEAPFELVSKMRASFNVIGSLLGRYKQARVSLPGGCSIGKRGIDLHIKGLEAIGAKVDLVHGFVETHAEKLVGAEVVLDLPSVGATENIMVASVFVEGTTVISNAAQEPEIIDLANFLNAMGANVEGAGTNEILIHGVPEGSLTGCHYTVLPDRIEAATFLIAAAATGGQITVCHTRPNHYNALIHKLTEMNIDVQITSPDTIQLTSNGQFHAQNIDTLPYPGFPTDLQAPMMSLLSIAEGTSVIRETIYENRFRHVGHLKRMGAKIEHDGNLAIVTGVKQLSGAEVKSSDLRAAAGLVIAGLHAEGTTLIDGLFHLDRGYDNLEEKFRQLGADIERVEVASVSEQAQEPTSTDQTSIPST